MTTLPLLFHELKADSHASLLVPFSAIWVLAYVYCYRCQGGIEAFTRCSAVHQSHAVAVCILAATSLYYGDDAIFSESIPIFFSSTYFLADTIDCLVRRDLPFLVHAIITLGLGHAGFVAGPLRDIRIMSRGYMIELSNIQLYRWKESKTKSNFALFVGVFTITRIIFFPAFVITKVFELVGMQNFIFPPLMILFALQLVWWVKMMEILSNYKVKVVAMESTVYASDEGKKKSA